MQTALEQAIAMGKPSAADAAELRVYISNWSYCSMFLKDPKYGENSYFILRLINLEYFSRRRTQLIDRLTSRLYTLARKLDKQILEEADGES